MNWQHYDIHSLLPGTISYIPRSPRSPESRSLLLRGRLRDSNPEGGIPTSRLFPWYLVATWGKTRPSESTRRVNVLGVDWKLEGIQAAWHSGRLRGPSREETRDKSVQAGGSLWSSVPSSAQLEAKKQMMVNMSRDQFTPRLLFEQCLRCGKSSKVGQSFWYQDREAFKWVTSGFANWPYIGRILF